MSGICDTCHRDQCNLRMDGLKMCDLHERGETRYEQLFGTPERAAETLEKAQLETCDYCEMVDSRCDECRYEFDRYGCCEPAPLLEWLRGDAE